MVFISKVVHIQRSVTVSDDFFLPKDFLFGYDSLLKLTLVQPQLVTLWCSQVTAIQITLTQIVQGS